MKAFAVVNQGLEQLAAIEIKELLATPTVNDSVLTFPVKNLKDLCALTYRAQSVSRVCYSLCEFAVSKSLETTLSNFKKQLNLKISDWIAEGESFIVTCERFGEHDFNSLDFTTAANKLISELGSKTDFKSPNLKFFCLISKNKGYFGVDLAGYDLSKRDYRIFGHSSDLKATAAYALVRLSNFKTGILLDPFCRSGAIAIEAALFLANFPVNYYRKDTLSFLNLKPFSKINFDEFFAAIDKKIKPVKQIFNYSSSIAHVRSAEKNAKIAGINKSINFGRVDAEWLELKFNRNSVAAIISFPPFPSKISSESEVNKLYSELFYQADFILSKKGIIVLAARDEKLLKEAAAKHKFKLKSKTEFFMGTETKLALVFSKTV